MTKQALSVKETLTLDSYFALSKKVAEATYAPAWLKIHTSIWNQAGTIWIPLQRDSLG